MNLQRNCPEDANFACRIDRTVINDWNTVISQLCRTFYGIQSAECTVLTGYDDINFKLSKCVFFDGKKCNSLTLKFVNHWEAKFYPKLCEAQAELSQLMADKGIKCPKIIKTIDGLLYFDYHFQPTKLSSAEVNCIDKSNTFVHRIPTPIVLRTFVPGMPLGNWVNSTPKATKTFIDQVDIFCEQIGTMLGKFHAICDRHKFCPTVFHQYAPIMALEHWHFHWHEFELQKATGKMGEKVVKLCAEVFEQFEQKVLTRKSEFEQGIVHGDFNESNILVTATTADESITRVSALIDFGDAHFSLRILDLANAIVYLYMLWSDLVPSAGPTDLCRLAKCLSRAYSASLEHPFPSNDLSHLALFLRARLVLSLVNGRRTERLGGQTQKGMEYVLKQQKIGQKVLEELSNCDGAILK